MSARGFSLLELLIATLVLLAVSGAAAALTGSMRDAFERTLTAGDAVTRNRSALELLAADLRQAGTGLADVDAIVVPHLSLERLEPTAPFTALSVRRVAQHAARGVLRDSVPAGAVTLRLEDDFACAGTDRSCGFAAGAAAAIHDSARLERLDISGVTEAESRLVLSRPLRMPFVAGASVVAVETPSYGLRAGGESIRLVRVTSAGAEQTVIDHVVRVEFEFYGVSTPPSPPVDDGAPPSYGPQPPRIAFDDERDVWPPGENCTMAITADGARVPRLASRGATSALVRLDAASLQDGPWCPDAAAVVRFDADLLRVRAIGVSLTLEVASARLRGPASRLFGRAGTGSRASQWVPDVGISAVVTLRSRG